MGCPYFEIQKSEDFDNAAEIISADKEPKRFTRRRGYTPFDLGDGSIRSALDNNIRPSQSGYFDGLRLFSIIFPIMVAISLYTMIGAAPENRLGLIAIPITAFGFGVLWVIFLVCFAKEYRFVKSSDELFIAYDGDGNPYAVEVGKRRIRVLYKDALYIIKGKRTKTVHSERELYYAYLNMFPQSALNIGKYLDNSDRSMEPVLIPKIEYSADGCCTLSIGERGRVQRSGKHGRVHKYPLLHHLHFCKYIFTVNGELKLTSVHSAARESAAISHDILTLATVVERGDEALEALGKVAAKNCRLAEALGRIDN